jgi:hypothetical protein
VAGGTGTDLFPVLRRKKEVDMINRVTIAFAAAVFIFAFILLAYGLYLVFGNLVLYAAAAGVVVGMFVYLVDAVTSKPQ